MANLGVVIDYNKDLRVSCTSVDLICVRHTVRGVGNYTYDVLLLSLVGPGYIYRVWDEELNDSVA